MTKSATILINGALNAKIVGQPAPVIASMAGVNVPENTKILIGEVESVDISEPFAHEKLSPVLAMYKAKDFDDALNKAAQLVATAVTVTLPPSTSTSTKKKKWQNTQLP